MAAVKQEIKPEIKVEAATGDSSQVAEVDEFEDDTDLVIPPNGGSAWLVKLPDYLWKTWSDMYTDVSEDHKIEIGKMRVYTDGPDPAKQKVQLRLDSKLPEHADLPLNYDVNITTNGYSNLVVFSEKDLPGHKSQPLGYRSHLSAGRPSGINKHDRYSQPVKPGSYRTAIPKQTALAPLIQHVADANPVEDESYYQHFTKMYNASIAPKKTTIFHTGIDRETQPGRSNLAAFSSFGITSKPKGGKKKGAKEKAVRISEQALMDAIYQCFRRFKYWPLKALKNELKQPEQYIKENLDGIATLVRSGDFAMTYQLKEQYAQMHNIKQDDMKEETAAVKSEVESDSGTGSDPDDDLGDFEDVKMGGEPGPS